MINLLAQMEQLGFHFNFSAGSFGIIVYILESLTLYTIAKRREIKRAYLAWIPVVNIWILGSISDQYQYIVKGKVKNMRKNLLALSIALAVMVAILLSAIVLMIINLLFAAGGVIGGWMGTITEQDIAYILKHLTADYHSYLLIIALIIPLVIVCITHTVLFWVATYDLFRSCEPNNAVLYLIISIIGGMVIEGLYSVFMLICREKDLGMPPRKSEPEACAPQQLEAESVESTEG